MFQTPLCIIYKRLGSTQLRFLRYYTVHLGLFFRRSSRYLGLTGVFSLTFPGFKLKIKEKGFCVVLCANKNPWNVRILTNSVNCTRYCTNCFVSVLSVANNLILTRYNTRRNGVTNNYGGGGLGARAGMKPWPNHMEFAAQ